MATILVVSFTDLKRDPRVHRQIKALQGNHKVLSVGTGDPELPGVHFIPCNRQPRNISRKIMAALALLLRCHESYYWSIPHIAYLRHKLKGLHFDIAIANDIESLPLVLEVAKGRPVIFDAHEYSPLEFEDQLKWRFFFAPYMDELCRRFMPRAAAITTVCEGISNSYREEYGVKSSVLTNAAPFHAIPVRATEHSSIRMIHHGAAIASRRIDLMIDLMGYLDERFSLDFILVPGQPAYIEWIKRSAIGKPKIRFLDPVPMDQLVTLSSKYDIGLFLLPPTNFNYRMALPNKFFEFIQARLAIAVGPSPEMARIVQEFECGVVAEDFSPLSLARALTSLSAQDIDRMKKGANRAALEHNAEHNKERFCALVDSVLAGAQ